MTTGHRLFCKDFLCFNPMPRRHIRPYLCTSEPPAHVPQRSPRRRSSRCATTSSWRQTRILTPRPRRQPKSAAFIHFRQTFELMRLLNRARVRLHYVLLLQCISHRHTVSICLLISTTFVHRRPQSGHACGSGSGSRRAGSGAAPLDLWSRPCVYIYIY